MAFDFPNAPTTGQVYGGYSWDGEKWIGATSSGAIYVNDPPPPNAPVNSLWWNSATGVLSIKYYDGNSTQWVALLGGSGSAVLYDTAQSLTSAQQAQARSNIGVTKKNYIINGAMMVSQENGGTVGTTVGYYPVDAFVLSGTVTGGSAQQVASVSPAGSPNRTRVTVTTPKTPVAAGDIFFLEHGIEGLRVADLNFGAATAKTVTLQFGVKAPAGTYGVVLLNKGSSRTYVSEYVIAAGEANTDIMRSLVIPGDTIGTWPKDNTGSFYLRWGLMVGSTYQQAAGTWGTTNAVGSPNQFNFMGTVGNVFELFDVGLYEGTVAPPFVVPDYASELAACRRYFIKFNAEPLGWTASTNIPYGVLSFKNAMRSNPTMLSGASFSVGAGAAGTPFLNSASNMSAAVYNSAANWNLGVSVTFTGSFDARL
jgi:hypothetical protein